MNQGQSLNGNGFRPGRNQKATGCSAIYAPKGAAREYAELALNIYTGCTHGCRYCYAPSALRKSKEAFFRAPSPRQNILPMVQRDAAYLSKWVNVPEILISFIGDPYQPAEQELCLTRQVIEILIEYNLPFTILTKGNPERDFDLISKHHNKARVGVTMTLLYESDIQGWERNAPGIVDRFGVLARAKQAGIPTWVSLEPVIDPDQALIIIGLYNRYVDFWRIGKLNHNKAVEDQVDWPAFAKEASAKLNTLGARFEFKRSLLDLHPFSPGRHTNRSKSIPATPCPPYQKRNRPMVQRSGSRWQPQLLDGGPAGPSRGVPLYTVSESAEVERT